MKYTAVLLLALFAISMAVRTNNKAQNKASLKFQSQMKELQKTSWGKVAASFLDL